MPTSKFTSWMDFFAFIYPGKILFIPGIYMDYLKKPLRKVYDIW